MITYSGESVSQDNRDTVVQVRHPDPLTKSSRRQNSEQQVTGHWVAAYAVAVNGEITTVLIGLDEP